METAISILVMLSLATYYYGLRLQADVADALQAGETESPELDARRRKAQLWHHRADLFMAVMQVTYLVYSIRYVRSGELGALPYLALWMMVLGGRVLAKAEPLPASALTLTLWQQVRMLMRSVRYRLAFPLIFGGLILFVGTY